MRVSEILLAISQITEAESLSKISNAVRDRRQSLSKIAAADIKAGDYVMFADNIRPTYLKGLPAEVVATNRESVNVRCPHDTRYGRFSGSPRARLPVSLIGRKLTDEEVARHKAQYANQQNRPRPALAR